MRKEVLGALALVSPLVCAGIACATTVTPTSGTVPSGLLGFAGTIDRSTLDLLLPLGGLLSFGKAFTSGIENWNSGRGVGIGPLAYLAGGLGLFFSPQIVSSGMQTAAASPLVAESFLQGVSVSVPDPVAIVAAASAVLAMVVLRRLRPEKSAPHVA